MDCSSFSSSSVSVRLRWEEVLALDMLVLLATNTELCLNPGTRGSTSTH